METAALHSKYDELKPFLKSVILSDTISVRAGLSHRDGTHCSIVPLWYFSSGSTERATSNSHVCFDQQQSMETARDENNFQLCLSVFPSDLSRLVALAPWATERLVLCQLTSVYCKCLRKMSWISMKWSHVLETELKLETIASVLLIFICFAVMPIS